MSNDAAVLNLLTGSMSLTEYFWSHINIGQPDECWEWQGRRKKLAGYGHFGLGDRFLRAHRVVLILSGENLKDSDVVLHTCDNRACCNPRHLKIGTQKENMQDMRRKGRGVDPPILRGEDNNKAKLTTEDVLFIRGSSLSGVELASRFDIATSTVSAIKHRKNWKHV